MAKRAKIKRKDAEAMESISLKEPCGEVCGVHEGQFCPECGDYAAMQHEQGAEQAETARESDDR